MIRDGDIKLYFEGEEIFIDDYTNLAYYGIYEGSIINLDISYVGGEISLDMVVGHQKNKNWI